MIALIHIYCSTSLCVIYKSLLIHDIQVLIYRGSTNERLSGEGVAYDSYYNETDRVSWPHYLVPCFQGGDVNSQLVEIGDGMSGRAIVPLVVQCPGGWLPAELYTGLRQVHISLMPKSP